MRATVITWTVVRAPPPGFAADRVVVLAERDDGSRVFAEAASEVFLRIGGSGTLVPGSPSRFTPD